MNSSRRAFLQSTGLGFLALGLPPPFLVRAAQAQSAKNKSLVVVFQRGAMDGLNVVIPFKDPAYYKLRPSINLRAPGSNDESAIDLDGFYALHPALAPLKSIYDKGHLGFIQATGSPDNTRSHFDAQDYMEIGTPGIKSTPDGWLNRCLLEDRKSESQFRGVAVTAQLPRMLAGPAPALTLSSIEEFRFRNEALGKALQKLYANTQNSQLRFGAANLFGAMTELKRLDSKIPVSSERYPAGRFGTGLSQIARLIKADVGLEVAFTEIGGWDTHANEGDATGQLANRLKELGEGLAAFYRDLGDRMDDVVLLTMSEFGRTAQENGNRGTDHGHANVMFVLGGAVRGGKVYGKWPGLARDQLFEGRDLALTTDFRSVLGEIIATHLGTKDLGPVFPGFDNDPRKYPRLLMA
jgi:uncharacterized protein (DUF1501 family)